jgi:hypothetical protein
MKKILFNLFLVTSFATTAQVLQTENFNALTVGNVGTDITGVTAGQGGWLTSSDNGTNPTTTTNAGNANFQIVATGNSTTNGALFQGPNGDKGARFMWKDGLPAAWTGRTSGNNIIELEVDINPGAGTTTSRNVFGIFIYNADYSKTLCGFLVDASTRQLFLQAYSNSGTVNNWNYSLAAAPGLLLPADVFSRIGISYNKTTGQVKIKAPGLPVAGLSLTSSAPGTDPAEVDFGVFSGSTGGTTPILNTSSTSVVFDNFVLRASATDTLLSTPSNTITDNSFSIYPNPAANVLNISNTNNFEIKNISVVDINGRVVKNQSGALTEINVSDLNTGIYFVTIETNEGKATKKFMKQ